MILQDIIYILTGQIFDMRYHSAWLIEHGLTSPPTQYRLYGRRFLQVKRPNQQYKVLKEQVLVLRHVNYKFRVTVFIHFWQTNFASYESTDAYYPFINLLLTYSRTIYYSKRKVYGVRISFW